MLGQDEAIKGGEEQIFSTRYKKIYNKQKDNDKSGGSSIFDTLYF